MTGHTHDRGAPASNEGPAPGGATELLAALTYPGPLVLTTTKATHMRDVLQIRSHIGRVHLFDPAGTADPESE